MGSAIAEAQQRRWAASRGQSEAATPEPAKPKRRLSAAGRRAIIAATKKRWALIHAEAAKAAPKSAAVKTTSTKRAAKKRASVKAAAKNMETASAQPAEATPAQ